MEIQEKIAINKSREEVYDFLMNLENRKSYIPLLKEVILNEELPLKVGSSYTELAEIAGREIQTTYAITHLEPPELIAVKAVKSVFPIQVDLLLQEKEESTIVNILLSFTLKGIYKLGAPLVKGIVQQQAKEILNKMKNNLEY